MGKLEITEAGREGYVEYDEPAEKQVETLWLSLLGLVDLLRAAVHVTEFRLRPWPASPPGEWQYRFVLGDGRVWEQRLYLSDATPYTCDWQGITGAWSVAEFRPHRALRDFSADIAGQGMVTDVKIEWP